MSLDRLLDPGRSIHALRLKKNTIHDHAEAKRADRKSYYHQYYMRHRAQKLREKKIHDSANHPMGHSNPNGGIVNHGRPVHELGRVTNRLLTSPSHAKFRGHRGKGLQWRPQINNFGGI